MTFDVLAPPGAGNTPGVRHIDSQPLRARVSATIAALRSLTIEKSYAAFAEPESSTSLCGISSNATGRQR